MELNEKCKVKILLKYKWERGWAFIFIHDGVIETGLTLLRKKIIY